MNRLLIVGILISYSAAPQLAWAQQPDMAKLKSDAQRVVSNIKGEKIKLRAYCQIDSLGEEIDRAAQKRDQQTADRLTRQINDLEKQLGPEYGALFDALNNADNNSNDFQEILAMFDVLDKSCPR